MRMMTAAIILASALLSLPCSAVVLVRDGQPEATIVAPAGASATVDFAAAELARYIELISGVALPVVAEGEAVEGVVVQVGPVETDQSEAIVLHVGDDGVRIGGDGDRGTLFAVYRFLEVALGCRWLALDQEFVPTSATVDVPTMDLTTAPAFDMRTFVARQTEKRVWGMKIGMNGFFTAEDVETTGGGYYLPAEVPMCHAYHLVIPAEEYFDDHPEWFPLVGGQRKPGALHASQLCVTANGLADEFARRVIEMFDADPDLKVMSISPNDGYGWCECEECSALDERLCGSRTTQQGLSGERAFRGDRVFWFANEVAGRVAKVHPDKLLLVLAYVNYAERPDTIVPASNVVPWLCHYAPADYSRPIADPTSEPNAQFNSLLVPWAESAPHLLFYAYVSKSMWWRLPRPVMHTFAADVKHLHDLGIRRYYCQSTLYDWPLDGPLYYVIAKLLWDPSQDPDAIAADWVQHMFGPAAADMSTFYAAVEDSIRESGQSFSDNPPRHVPGLYSHEDLARAKGHIEAALISAADDEVALERVQQVEEIFRYGRHMIAALEAADEFQQQPSMELLADVREQYDIAWEIYPYRYSKRFFDGIKMSAQLGVLTSGFGDAEEKGERTCWNSDETGVGDNRSGWATFHLELEDTERAVRLEMDVWGTSELTGEADGTALGRGAMGHAGIHHTGGSPGAGEDHADDRLRRL